MAMVRAKITEAVTRTEAEAVPVMTALLTTLSLTVAFLDHVY